MDVDFQCTDIQIDTGRARFCPDGISLPTKWNQCIELREIILNVKDVSLSSSVDHIHVDNFLSAPHTCLLIQFIQIDLKFVMAP